MRKMDHYISKSFVCPCCYKAYNGAQLSIQNLAPLFNELCFDKLEDQQFYKAVKICYKCYARLKLAYSYRKLFYDLIMRLKVNGPLLEEEEVQSDVVDVPVVARCPVCLITHPTVQHVYEHLNYTRRSNGYNTNSANIRLHSYQSTECNPYLVNNDTVSIVYRCSAKCGASFVRRGLLDVHQLMCRYAPLAYESSDTVCVPPLDTALDEMSDFDESLCEVQNQQTIKLESASINLSKNVVSREPIRKQRSITNRTNANDEKHTAPKVEQTYNTLRVKAANSDRIYYKKFCSICNKWFTKLNVHIRTHNASRRYECKLCHKSLASECSLSVHQTYSCPLIKNQTSNTEAKPFVCTVCSKSYPNKFLFLRHAKIHVKVSCSVCNKMVVKSMLNCHMITAHSNDRIICNYCGKLVKSRYALTAHIKLYHRSDVTFYECDKCDKKFKMKVSLMRHLPVHEVGQREHPCKLCNLTFFCRSSLRIHTNAVHKKLGSRKCNVCGLMLSSASTLKVHERQHTGIKPYACDVCGKTFTQKPPLNRHRRSQHDIKPTLVEKCSLCNNMFASKKMLKIHMVKVH